MYYETIGSLRILKEDTAIKFEIKTCDNVLADASLNKSEIEKLYKLLIKLQGQIEDDLPI